MKCAVRRDGGGRNGGECGGETKESARYRCVVCGRGEIVATRTAHAPTEFSMWQSYAYSDSSVTGGKLLEKRPETKWEDEGWIELKKKFFNSPPLPRSKLPLGGICVTCLKNPIVQKLKSLIAFETFGKKSRQ